MCVMNETMIISIYIKIEKIYLTYTANHCIFAEKTVASTIPEFC